MTSTDTTAQNRFISIGTFLLAACYALAVATGHIVSTRDAVDHTPAANHTDEHANGGHGTEEHEAEDHGTKGDGTKKSAAGRGGPPYSWVVPFAILLGVIAIFPLLNATEHWWEKNLHRFYVSAALATVTLALYWFDDGTASVWHVVEHAMAEYIPFIVLLFSLYTISGGIRIEGDLTASPTTNATFIAIGGILASFVGTTGAAVLLIRPLLDTNDERRYVQHTVVFFIFVVCNCGGCLLPIGDPPLFLGYLEGVAFLWTMFHLWLPWLVVNLVLIAVYWCMDRYRYYPKETFRDVLADATQTRPLRVKGLIPNLGLLIGVVLCVALLDPSKPVPGIGWYPLPYLREVAQLVLVGMSLAFGADAVRRANRFDYHAIVEVAVLFIGIFICMQPALEILNDKGPRLGLDHPAEMYLATGFLSSVLDNAPTYLVVFRTAAAQYGGVPHFAELVSGSGPESVMPAQLLTGISLGAVFMGAMTYIGNGPNFMVRAIAEQSGVRMPSFFGYIVRYSIPILLPVLLLAMFLFLMGGS